MAMTTAEGKARAQIGKYVHVHYSSQYKDTNTNYAFKAYKTA